MHPNLGELTEIGSIYEREVLRRLLEDEGQYVLAHSDKAVQDLLGLKINSPTGSSMACDFLTFTEKNMLHLSELKGKGGGTVDILHALQQLRNVMKALEIKKLPDGTPLAYFVERVQIFVQKGSKPLFNGKYTEEAGQLVFKGEPVTLSGQGRPDLIVQVVEMVE
jgi:hypothetical protein